MGDLGGIVFFSLLTLALAPVVSSIATSYEIWKNKRNK